MAQQHGPSAGAQTGNQRTHFRQSLELPIAVSVRGMSAPVYATLIDLSGGGCRFRSLILFERDRVVEFTLRRRNGMPIALIGRIVGRNTPKSGAPFEYGVAFDRLAVATQVELAAVLLEMQRRAAASRAAEREPPAAPTPTAPGRQRRRTVRTMIAFPIRYRRDGKTSQTGEASDIGSGGLRLACLESLSIGTLLEMRFTLPSSVLLVFPEQSDSVEITPFGPKHVRIPNLRRPFEEMILRGRVVSQFAPHRNLNVHGIEFIEIDGYTREEIARFAHASQLMHLRSTA